MIWYLQKGKLKKTQLAEACRNGGLWRKLTETFSFHFVDDRKWRTLSSFCKFRSKSIFLIKNVIMQRNSMLQTCTEARSVNKLEVRFKNPVLIIGVLVNRLQPVAPKKPSAQQSVGQ